MNDLSVRRAPAGKALQLRYVTVVNAQTGVRRKVPVGKLSAPIFDGPQPHRVELLDHPSTGVPETFVVSSYVGEQRR